MDLSNAGVGLGTKTISLSERAPARLPSLTSARTSKTVQMLPPPQSSPDFPLILHELRSQESVTFPVTLGCLQPIGWQQIYFSLSGPIVVGRGSAHCLVTVTNMLIREARMMDGSPPESGPGFKRVIMGLTLHSTSLSLFLSILSWQIDPPPLPHRSNSRDQELTVQPLCIASESK